MLNVTVWAIFKHCVEVLYKKLLCRDIKERKRRRQLNAIIRPSTKSLRAREDGDQIVPMIQIKVTAEIAEPNIRRSDNVVPEIRVEEPTTIVGGAPSLSEGTSSGNQWKSVSKIESTANLKNSPFPFFAPNWSLFRSEKRRIEVTLLQKRTLAEHFLVFC